MAADNKVDFEAWPERYQLVASGMKVSYELFLDLIRHLAFAQWL